MTKTPTSPDRTDGDKLLPDGGVKAGGDGPDFSVVAGEPPKRNGERVLVTSDETVTPYTGDRLASHTGELCGLSVKAETSFSSDIIKNVRITPTDPSRPRSAAGHNWLMRTALQESPDEYDLWDRTDPMAPLEGYQPETTADYRQADPEDPRGDGVYARDKSDSPLTSELATIITRNNGRIPVNFSAAVQNEGYSRSRDWTAYAPGHNPYHVAAAVTDLLHDTDGISNFYVHVGDKTAEDIATDLRSSRFGHVYALEDEAQMDRVIRELRWQSGLPYGRLRALDAAPSQARHVLEWHLDRDRLKDSHQTRVRKLADHPGDVWDYHRVDIHVIEEATEPHYG
jgi:hypothetical protein